MPRSPVDEEQDVTGFLLDDGLERVDERLRKECGALGRFEQAEGEEAIDALAVTGHHEGPFRVALHHVVRLGRERDAVGRDEIGEHVFVAALLEGVELDRCAQQGIGSDRGKGGDIEPRPPFGLHGDIPDGQAHEAIARLRIELGPIDHRRFVGIEGVQQRPAEEGLVRVAADANRSLGEGLLRAGGCGDRRDGRIHGSKLRLGVTPREARSVAAPRKSPNPPSRSEGSRHAAMTSGAMSASSSSRQ